MNFQPVGLIKLPQFPNKLKLFRKLFRIKDLDFFIKFARKKIRSYEDEEDQEKR